MSFCLVESELPPADFCVLHRKKGQDEVEKNFIVISFISSF